MKRALMAIAFAAIVSTAAAQTLPDVGRQLCSDASYSGRNVWNGCSFRFQPNKDGTSSCALVCESQISGVIGRILLSQGTITQVANPRVTKASIVTCGCDLGTADIPGCNEGGWWLARDIETESQDTGVYWIRHAYAEGDEYVTCMVR